MSRAITKFPYGYGKKQNDLFAPGPTIRLNACVGWNGGPAHFSRYSSGYFLAGQRLVESVEADSMRCVDLLVYPIVMVYRHGVESALKYLRRRLPILFDEPTQFKLNHDILVNWKAVRAYLSRLEGSAERSELDQIQKTLNDLVEFDPNGMVSRYPEDKEGAMHLEDTAIINVRIFADRMKPLGDFLENCSGWVDYLIFNLTGRHDVGSNTFSTRHTARSNYVHAETNTTQKARNLSRRTAVTRRGRVRRRRRAPRAVYAQQVRATPRGDDLR